MNHIMFTDEKIVNRNGYFNVKNNVVWAVNRSEANANNGIYIKEKYPVSVMVGLTVPYFFEKDERLNGRIYFDK